MFYALKIKQFDLKSNSFSFFDNFNSTSIDKFNIYKGPKSLFDVC